MNDLERVICYLDNELTDNENKQFENDLTLDTQLRKTLELTKEVDATLADRELLSFYEKLQHAKTEFKSEEMQDASKKQKSMNQVLLKNLRIGWNLRTIAATFIMIVASVTVLKLISKPSADEIFKQYYNKYEANVVTRSESTDNSTLVTAIQLYDKGSYTAAIQKFLNIIKTDANNTAARFFLGVSYLETKNINKAVEHLTFVIAQQDSAFVEHAEWYLALCYVKNGHKKEAIALLTKISNNQNFYKLMAYDVLKKLR